MKYTDKLGIVPLWERLTLSVSEAAIYSGVSKKKLAEITGEPTCEFVMWVGKKKMIKREKLDEYIDQMYVL